MARAAALLAMALLTRPLAGTEPAVTMLLIADEGSFSVPVVRAVRGEGPGATIVAVLAGPRDRLFLRRSSPEPAVVLHEAWIGRPSGVSFTRRERDPVLAEAGGRSLRFFEADLPRPTVRCWLAGLVSRSDPKLLEVAAAIRLLKESSGATALGDVFYPMTLLWDAGDPPSIRTKGVVTARKGPFTGEPWDRLVRDAVEELGRR